jgi:hypothetical protein
MPETGPSGNARAFAHGRKASGWLSCKQESIRLTATERRHAPEPAAYAARRSPEQEERGGGQERDDEAEGERGCVERATQPALPESFDVLLASRLRFEAPQMVAGCDCVARVRRKSLFEGLPRLLDRSDGLVRAPQPWTTAQDVRHRSPTTRRLPRLLATTCAVAACAALTG